MSSLPALRVGQLVEITGLKELADTPAEWRRGTGDGPKDVNGQMGQLTEWDEEGSQWMVATFGASMVSVKEQCLRPLNASDVEGFDVALGPASDMQVMGSELTDNLCSKGFVLCKLFVAPEDLQDMVATADRCAQDGAFSRLSPELEPGYLGKEGSGKTLAVDMDQPDTADFVKESALKIAEDAISTVGDILRPFTEPELGFQIYSRSTTMLSMPFEDDEDSYMPPDLENEDAAAYLTMLWRAKLMVIFNAGPGTATLTLIPKNSSDTEPRALLQPGMVAIFQMDRYRFAYDIDEKALMLSTFFLDEPKEYTLDNIYGNFSDMSGSLAGPPMPTKDQIPVVSMGTRYAFGADEPWKVWVGYSKAGWDTQTRHPFYRWDCDVYYEKDADQTSGKSYTCHGGFSDGIELFDCKFFDISPAEARGMDPTQRQVLEVSYIALQGAGFSKRQLQAKPANIACFVGLDKNEWQGIPKDQAGGFGASNSANAITSNRFNYCMNLKGASMTIDTACSSSLVATHTGKLYLMFNKFDACEASIVCGVNLSMSPMTYIGCCAAGMHSHLGRCFTYNFSADGYARGEATASLGIKCKDFDKDGGDFCLLAGSQVNQDGRSASLTAPNGPAQERCSNAVIKEVGIKPPEIDTTECHGTGTSLGDPIEIGAYRKVMAAHPREEPVVITTSKSNIGHCEGSAGISGFLKCVLLCMYNEATPNVHFSATNPHLDMDGFPGIITSEGCLFKAENSYNSVLSFGFGGTNACAMCWGSNIMTSRAMASKDVFQFCMQKIQDAPAQEVTITGDDWEEWDIEFPIRDPKPSDRWDVEIDEDGMVTYMKQEKELQDESKEYYLTGTFNNWGHDPFVADSGIDGLYVAEITLGQSGTEMFQINADMDSSSTYFPEVPGCTAKSGSVRGPDAAEKEQAWCITGEMSEKFRIEFFITEARSVSVSWIKEK